MTAPREVNLQWENEPNEKINAWLAANKIDPSDVPAAQVATVTDTTISIIKFMEDENGNRVMAPGGQEWLKEAVDYDLIARLEAFDL